jgi:hypothetical protein
MLEEKIYSVLEIICELNKLHISKETLCLHYKHFIEVEFLTLIISNEVK